MVLRPPLPVVEGRRPKSWLSTAEGWSTAHLLYLRAAHHTPRAGSHQEMILRLFILRKDYSESEVTKILVVAGMEGADPSKVSELWKEYITNRYPWFIHAQQQEKAMAKEVLSKEMAKGPVQVTPLLPDRKREVKLRQLPPEPVPPPATRVRIGKLPHAHALRNALSSVPKPGGGGLRRTRR